MAATMDKDNNDSEPDPYDTDEGDDYVPDDQSDSSENDETEHVTPRKTKKRRKNIALWKRNEKKRLRTAGKMYEGHKGKIRPERNLRPFVHTCRYSCSKMSEAERQTFFDKFYNIPTYDLQTAFLASCIQKCEVVRRSQRAECNQYCNVNQKPLVKLSYYRHIFNTEFNLRFHKPHSDTCSKCDKLNNIIKNSNNENEVSISKVSLELHQRKAQKACEMKKMDAENSKALDDTIAICFDLQQTLPTPLLTTSKVFYLRQLWTYNFCIHNLCTGEARMYTWDETVSGRGSQEIGSCLLHFFKSLPSNITKIIAYSDSCGGQNKNKNICKLFMFAIKATHIKEIHHKFLEPGHTYMECDRDFALIEKNKKKIPQVFIPSHWREVIAASNKKFMIHNMTREMFFSFEKLNQIVKDPKKDVDGKPIKFKEIAYFKYDKSNEAFSFEFKPVLDASYPFIKCVSGSRASGRPSYSLQNSFTPLHGTSVPIKTEKWKNLQTLLDYIPPVYHAFYKNMKHEDLKKRTNETKICLYQPWNLVLLLAQSPYSSLKRKMKMTRSCYPTTTND
ncbi:unnamed protein product [Acanthoscelides obtectus]|uniref:DUF7869 domain-containing protein n=1 Tax=Acanthoscelides obtectus TaxID=200917 RepID=A0A9P0P979_ACAOB|nr:unnamed protein product [Acanthoscelides obtectus]CAK1662951.1 hypothetical protein AOBTE_LOCUS23391 [Acanthoscelides obtectus]